MRSHLAPTLMLTILAAVCAAPASASPELRWLNYSPVRFFTDQDWELALAATHRALDSAKNGETVSWENPDSGSHGSITPMTTESRDNTTCRQAKVVNHARKLDGGGTFVFCRRADGSWGIEHDSAGS